MIEYKLDVMKALAERGYTANKMRREKILGQSTMQRLREKKDINTATLNIICVILKCKPSDIFRVTANDDEKIKLCENNTRKGVDFYRLKLYKKYIE